MIMVMMRVGLDCRRRQCVDGLMNDDALADESVVTGDAPQELVLLHPVLLGNSLDFGVDVFLGCFDFHRFCNLFENQVALDPNLCNRLQTLPEVLHGLIAELKILLQFDSLLSHPHGLVSLHLFDFRVNHALRNKNGRMIADSLNDRVIVLFFRVLQGLLFHLIKDILSILNKGIEFTDIFSKFIIQLRQFLLAYRM